MENKLLAKKNQYSICSEKLHWIESGRMATLITDRAEALAPVGLPSGRRERMVIVE